MSGFDCIPEQELFIGPPEAQANARFVHFADKLMPVRDRTSAKAALQMVIEQGEAPTKAHPDAHFWVFRAIHAEYLQAIEQAKASGAVFDPVRPVVSNPMTRFYDDTTGGTPISDPLTHQVAELFNVGYDTMLLILLRFFAHTDESEDELKKLSLASLHLMTSVLRPLGEALTKMPAGHGHRLAGKTAGPGFGYNRDIHLLPHKRSAWVFFGERLRELATLATGIVASQSGRLPPEVEEAAAGLQALSLQFAPADKTWNAVAELGEFRAVEAAQERAIKPSLNGPLLVTNVERFLGMEGQPLQTSPEMALCRCGGSKNKPFCDGTHARIGFSSASDPNEPDRTPDKSRDYRGAEITVHFNRLQCSASEQCHKNLSSVFRVGERPWIQADRDKVERVVEIVTRCPSGALRYTRNGELGPKRNDPPGIRIRKNGPYEVEGNIPLAHRPLERRRHARPLCAVPLRRLEEQAVLRRLALEGEVHRRAEGERLAYDPYLTRAAIGARPGDGNRLSLRQFRQRVVDEIARDLDVLDLRRLLVVDPAGIDDHAVARNDEHVRRGARAIGAADRALRVEQHRARRRVAFDW